MNRVLLLVLLCVLALVPGLGSEPPCRPLPNPVLEASVPTSRA